MTELQKTIFRDHAVQHPGALNNLKKNHKVIPDSLTQKTKYKFLY